MSGTAVVVGGGIAGVAAAVGLADAGWRVTIVEPGAVGGKLQTTVLGSVVVERGAEAILVRDLVARDFCRRLGVELLPPTAATPRLWLDGELCRLPPKTVLGIPSTVEGLVRTLPEETVAAVSAEADIAPPGDDLSVAALVHHYLGAAGDALTSRIVDPLLGGVYAGGADQISAQAAMPGLFGQLASSGTLLEAAQSVVAAGSSGPIFGAPVGGLSTLTAAGLAASHATVVRAPVRQARRRRSGWTVVSDVGEIDADAVVFATPPPVTSELLAGVLDLGELATLQYASVAVVTLVLPALAAAPISGVLIPRDAGLTLKAVTLTSQKWGRPTDVVVVRCSVGRFGEAEVVERPDAELLDVAQDELGVVLDTMVPNPVASAVYRWRDALPQYSVGHVSRVAIAHEAAASVGGLALAGAGYDGLGIAACIRSGLRAAALVAGQ